MLANGTLFKHLQVWWTTELGLSEILLVRNGSAGRRAGERVGRANVRDILIYDKWLLVKLPVCAKYVIITSGQIAL